MNKKIVAIGGGNNGRIKDDEYRLITSKPESSDLKPYGVKSYWEEGKYITEQISDDLVFKPLSELLARKIK